MAVHTKLMEEVLTSEEAQKIIDFFRASGWH